MYIYVYITIIIIIIFSIERGYTNTDMLYILRAIVSIFPILNPIHIFIYIIYIYQEYSSRTIIAYMDE